ncbi:MAG TPA: DUF4349 domain-containing protein, partial [Propionibacteriaceae bacterium]
ALPAQTTETQTKTDSTLPQTPVVDTQKITRSATMTVVVSDESAAATRLRAIATAHGGVVTTENVVSGGEKSYYATSTIVLSVPADELDGALTDIAAVGEVTLRTIQSTDVTAKVADVESRITTMRASIARMQELLTRAGSVTEIAQVETELTNREADLESLLAQQKVLAQRVAQSPITVTLTRVAVVEPNPVPETGFIAGLKAGWHALKVFGVALLTVVGALLPFLAVLALIAAPVVWLVRRRGGARPKVSAESNRPSGEDAPTL